MKLKILLLVVFTVGVLFMGCSPRTQETLSLRALPEEVKPTAKEAWKIQLDESLAQAKKEGKVVVISTAGSVVHTALSAGFKRAHGISVEFIGGAGAQVAGKLLAEWRAGLYLTDIYTGGNGTPLTQLKPVGVLDFIEPLLFFPEVLDMKLWLDGKLHFVDKDRLILSFIAYASTPIVINTEQVKSADIISYLDLLNPKWKGKIVMFDPAMAGMGLTQVRVIGEAILGWDYVKQLVKQEPILTRDHRQSGEWVARGKYPIAFALKPEIVEELKNVGAPLSLVTPKEGTYRTSGSGNVALIKRAPHPNAAKLFINWLLTKEGQGLFVQSYSAPSRRLDVSTAGIEPNKILQPGIKYIETDNEEFKSIHQEQAKFIAELFSPILR